MGAGGGVSCSELPVPRGPVGRGWGRASALGPARETRPHKHSGHSTGAGGQGEAGRHIALQERGVRWDPPLKLEPGEEAEVIVSLLGRRGEVTPPVWSWGRSLGSHAPGPSLPAGHQGQTDHRRGPAGGHALVSAPPGRIHLPAAAQLPTPPCPPLALGGTGSASSSVTVRAAATDVVISSSAAVLLPRPARLWDPGPRCSACALGHSQGPRGAPGPGPPPVAASRGGVVVGPPPAPLMRAGGPRNWPGLGQKCGG